MTYEHLSNLRFKNFELTVTDRAYLQSIRYNNNKIDFYVYLFNIINDKLAECNDEVLYEALLKDMAFIESILKRKKKTADKNEALLPAKKAKAAETLRRARSSKPLQYRLTNLVASARSRQQSKYEGECNITYAWLLSEYTKCNGICPMTGIPFSDEANSPYSISLDRIDRNKGYTRDNCQLVITMYNIAKNRWSDKQLLDMCLSMVKHRNCII